MKVRRIMLAAPGSGSGKTTLACGVLEAWKEKGYRVSSCKCGPDYIDPMFHQKVIGVPTRNLDTFFTGEEQTRELFFQNRREEEIVLIEGVMGLFDGLGGIGEEGSSYHLSRVTKTPILLVVDAKGMGRSLLPLLSGFLSYDTEKLIRGVILNRMTKGFYKIIKPLIEEELGLRVLGYLPQKEEFSLKSRHLGLVLPKEVEDLKYQLKELAREVERTVSLEEVEEIAAQAEGMGEEAASFVEIEEKQQSLGDENKGLEIKQSVQALKSRGESPLIGVARDEAFCFYYEENLRLLEQKGAKLVFFSPLQDTGLPEGISGLLLGGGYPELYAEGLSQNKTMRQDIRRLMDRGLPTVAECGGFMYLHDILEDKEGREYAMAGVLPGKCFFTGRLVRFGYIEVEEKESRFLSEGGKIRGHEFHYFDSTNNGEDCIATKPITGKQYSSVISGPHQWLGFPHLYYPSHPEFAENFVNMAAKYQCGKKSLAGKTGKQPK